MKKMSGFMKKTLLAIVLMLAVFSFLPETTDAATKVKMNRTKVTCTAKEWFALKVKGTKGKKVTWSSTKKSVATVNKKGFVKTKKAGKATIKAKVGGKTVKCKVTVKKNAKKPWLTVTTKTLHIGESFQLIEGWFTDYESTFSFNNRIATISPDGRVNATGVGTVNVMVTRGYGEYGITSELYDCMDKGIEGGIDGDMGKGEYGFCTINVVSGPAKVCKHNWMAAEDTDYNAILIPCLCEEFFDECHSCGWRYLFQENICKHSEEADHGGSWNFGSFHSCSAHNAKTGIPLETYKFCTENGVNVQYCRNCGAIKDKHGIFNEPFADKHHLPYDDGGYVKNPVDPMSVPH